MKITHCNSTITPLALSVSLILSFPVSAGYYFDPALLQGTGYGKMVDLSRFNQAEDMLPAGEYVLDVYLNGQLVRGREKIKFTESLTHPERTEPCLSASLIEASAIRVKQHDEKSVTASECRFIGELSSQITWQVNTAGLRLDITVPQAGLWHHPRGYIPVTEWDRGTTALFLRHNTNLYHTENTSSDYRYDYLWSNINSGLNLGLWQFRHQGNLRYADNNVNGAHYRYSAVRTWMQRPVPEIESMLYLGDNQTNNTLFGGLSFNGIRLGTDPRMWPQGKRGYAPEVRGVANTTARVTVFQQGRVIYETTVSPGAFVINDLYNTHSQGDLQVSVTEADGQVSTFTVPYSSVPDSVRPGNWSYELALGYVRHYYNQENKFFEGVLQRGVNNSLTTNVGARLADDYQAGLLGGVVSTPVGALGFNAVYSRAEAERGELEQGWRLEASYSKTFTSGTNLMLAAYRYSTKGYRDLQDVLGVRRQEQDNVAYYSDTLHQRNSFSATLSQSLNDWGQLSLNASTADYYGDSSRNTQFQLGYSTRWKFININLNAARQRSVYSPQGYYDALDDNQGSWRRYTENTFSLSFSVPLDFGQNRAQATFDMNKNRNSSGALTGISGTLGEQRRVSYSAYAGMDHLRQEGNQTTVGGSLEQRSSVGTFRASASRGHDYRQFGLGASGTVLLHSGGVTAGPYTSDTFALISAPGAQGATVRNGQGATVDRFGYALLPSMTPYRYNPVSLDIRDMDSSVELQGGSLRVVPYAGAISRVSFATVSGEAALINTLLPDGSTPPMGADVADSEGAQVGMVGQGGQIYARLPAQSGVLYVSWGKSRAQSCRVYYQLPGQSPATGLHQLTLPCRQE